MLKIPANAVAAFLITIFLSSATYSAENLTAESIKSVITEIAEAMTNQYVLPDVGEAMAQDLLARLDEGQYDGISNTEAFTTMLTEHMVEVSDDEHIFIFYSDAEFPSEEEMRNPPPEAQAQNIRFHEYNNFGIRSVGRLDGNIGYFDFESFMDSEPTARALANAMNVLQNTGGLIIDLRRNGGGMPATVSLLASYFLGPEPVHVDSIYWRNTGETNEFWTTAELDGAWYGTERPVFILTSAETFSAAEAFSYALQAFGRAEVVGEITRGGAHPGGMVRIAERYHMSVPNGRAINAVTGENWEGTGVTPDYPERADEALTAAYRLILQAVIAQTDSALAREDREMHLRRLESQ